MLTGQGIKRFSALTSMVSCAWLCPGIYQSGKKKSYKKEQIMSLLQIALTRNVSPGSLIPWALKNGFFLSLFN